MIRGLEQVWRWCVATACASDAAPGGPQCAQGAGVFAQTHEKLEGALVKRFPKHQKHVLRIRLLAHFRRITAVMARRW